MNILIHPFLQVLQAKGLIGLQQSISISLQGDNIYSVIGCNGAGKSYF